MSQRFAESENRPRSCTHPALCARRTCRSSQLSRLIKKRPGFLAIAHIDAQPNAIFQTQRPAGPAGFRRRTPPAAAMKSLRFGKLPAAASTITAGGWQAAQRRKHRFFAQLHPECRKLHRRDVAEDVDDKSRQAIAFAVHQPIRRRVRTRQPNRTAQQARFVNPPRNQRCHESCLWQCDRRLREAPARTDSQAEHPHRNLRSRIGNARPISLSSWSHRDDVTWRKTRWQLLNRPENTTDDRATRDWQRPRFNTTLATGTAASWHSLDLQATWSFKTSMSC